MSGDVQPRKRKDKKRKKDELGVEEPRGTAAVFGEGDVFMHSPNEHGTGGHWCAKVIFFSLLTILITLIGLIILENRGLTDLEANSVESRYAGVLEGWLEEAPDDDHHDEHTLELKHHDDEGDENDHGDELEHDDEDDDDHSDENDNEDEDDNNSDEDDDDEHNQDDEDDNNDESDNDEHNQTDEDLDDDDDDDEYNQDGDDEHNQDDEDDENDEHLFGDNSEEQNKEANNEDEHKYRRTFKRDVDADDDYNQADGNKDEEEEQFEDSFSEEDNNQFFEENYVVKRDNDNNDEENNENNDNEDDDFNQSIEDEDENKSEFEQNNSDAHNDEDEEEHEDEPEDLEIEVEKIEKEVFEEDDASIESPSYVHIGEVDGESQEDEKDADADFDGDVEEEEFLETEDEELPVAERITVPAGKPLKEVEDETSSERPPDTLADEEEYEKQQEELRREQEQASHLWLKLAVGGALLAATHAVVRRATTPRAADTGDEHASREETPSIIDRRMTLIMEEPPAPVVPKIVPRDAPKPIEREVVKKTPTVVKAPPPKQESEEIEEEEIQIISKAKKIVEALKDKELYSDEEDDEEEIVEKEEIPKPKRESVKEKEPTPEPDDDVEIIDDEQLEEELEEEDVEEEISDVDDAELLSRLEAKYGRLPEPERPERKHKDGGNSMEEDWPGEPSDPYWREQLDRAEEQLRQGEWSSSLERASGVAEWARESSARARWVVARALDAGAEERRDNALLGRAVAAYLHLLKMNERLTDVQLRTVGDRTLDRILFRGNYLGAEPIYRLLIRRFPDEPGYRNNLTVSFLMANRADLAEEVLKDTLKRWPNDRFALAHHGFVLKTQHNRLEEAVTAFQKALEGDSGPANEPRFYYHLGDALLLLGRFEEANEVHKRATALGHFLSPAQRSLYNVNRLTGRPWWNAEDTPYIKLIRALEKSWKEILREGEAARAIFEKEKEGLKERGEWSQLDLFVRGREIAGRCERAPVTCSIVRGEAAASGCRRGQVKFSALGAGSRVRAHVGPTNCRLRMHLGLANTNNTFIRVDNETRQWKTGKVFIFDDSFEHEVWHNGTGTRLVLIVDVWHPELTPAERRTLPAI